VKDPALGVQLSSRFQLCTLSTELVERGINPEIKDVLYNYINVTSMTKSQTKRAFTVAKEFHVITP
jgi:hypothetical protein